MKVQFLQHEYTWSNHCITGNTLGWGVTASSIPQSKTMLCELEKMASQSEPDRLDYIPVEEMIYSPVTGFVRLWTVPSDQGEDGRKNKLVRMLQTADPGDIIPAHYFAGLGAWKPAWQDEQKEEQLPRLSFDPYEESVDDILKSMNLYHRLPVFLRAVFWCLLEYTGSLDFVASNWAKEEFSGNAGKIMYALHNLLPQCLRKKAGYRSRTWQDCEGTSFYFSDKEYGSACFHLDQEDSAGSDNETDELEQYFYDMLAAYWKKEPVLYGQFMDEISDYLDEAAGRGNELKKIQWIFYEFALRQKDSSVSADVLPQDYILAHLPELIYWSHEDEALQKVSRKCLAFIHTGDMTGKQEQYYLKVLLEKVSKRSFGRVCREIIWVLRRMEKREPELAQQSLLFVKDNNKTIYRVIKKNLEKEKAWKEHFQVIDNMEELESAEESPDVPGTDRSYDHHRLQEEKRERGNDTGDEKDVKASCSGEKKNIVVSDGSDREAVYRKVEETDEEAEEHSGPFLEFLLTGLPFGFLTGCVMFLSHYSLMIGHWKIAVGMGGMWVLFILNYIYLLFSRHQKRPLWKSLGLCLVEGYLIEIAASMIIDQKLRLYFFIALGILMVAIQIFNIIRARREGKR